MWVDVDTAVTVPVNVLPLIDDSDFKTIKTAVAYNASGLALKWNFVTSDGVHTQTAVTPTTSGDTDWSHLGGGVYSIEIPASGGGTINNDTEGFGWFSGVATGVLPWRGPVVGFRAAGLNDALVDNAYSATRGLAGTALPNAAAEAAGGLYTRGSGAGQIAQSNNGRADSDVKSIANGVIAAATFAANALDAVWSTATRVLTAGTNIVLAKGTGITGFTDLDAAAVRAALGLSSANIDTQLSAIGTKTTNLPASPAATGDIAAALDSALADSIPAVGSPPSLRQAAYMLVQFFMERSISGTTMTVKKPDGSTTLFTLTLDDATTPRANTRAT